MRLGPVFTLTVSLLLAALSLSGQRLDHRLGFIMVQLEPDYPLDRLLAEQSNRAHGILKLDRVLSNRLGIYLLRFDHTTMHERNLLQQFRSDRHVMKAQFDHVLKWRATPDDPMYDMQWQWRNLGQTGGVVGADVNAETAWNYTTGGVTAAGDTIVVAIIDSGLDFNHEDIVGNVWINHGEIDGNNIDDDGNGYVDDIYGWNTDDDTPDVFGTGHGLQVAGMVGANGNNGRGITGINWKVKLMTIIGGPSESSAIASYAYALEQRILYNESNGEKGAFVVATNSSWGTDFGQPEDAPLWCGFYDILGAHGILSAAATANLNIDIDVIGDLPTACPSMYLLSVTALNHANNRTFTAFGRIHVDFAAPGENVFTTRRNNQYTTTSGTSFASPIAAGLVALLYAAPCPGFGELIHTQPAAAALYVRDLIFNGVQPIASLQNFTRFGGGLNAGNSMELMMAQCSDCPVPFAVDANILSDQDVLVTWASLAEPDSLYVRYRPLGGDPWDTLHNVTQPLLLSGLTGCTEYEIEFEAFCADTGTGFIVHHVFRTDGCCDLPSGISAFPGETQASVFWNDVLAAAHYVVQWRASGQPDWNELTTPDASLILIDLLPCTFYEVRLQTNCDTSETGFSDLLSFRTTGCGNCLDLPYCEVSSNDATEEHIDSLIIGPLVNHSGQNGGYMLFEDFQPSYIAGDTYSLWIRPGFGTGETFDEQFRIWLDVNQDGVFGIDELLLDTILREEDVILTGQLLIPVDALAGSTRLRISMAYVNPNNPTDQPPCGILQFGEIEDYCINIIKRPDDCPEVDTVRFDAITESSAFVYWPSAFGAIAYTYRWREVGEVEYTELATIDTTANLSDLKKCTSYEFQIRTVCTADTTSYAFNYILETDCDVAVEEPSPLLTVFKVYPNPATSFIVLQMESQATGDHRIAIYDLYGRLMANQTHHIGSGSRTEVRLDDLDRYPSGVYFVLVEKDGQTATHKWVKM